VKAIIRRFNRALENITEARAAFESLNEAAPPESVDVWEATIREAEAARSRDESAMDVMQSRIKRGQSLKEITAAILREELISQEVVRVDGSPTDWLLEGMRIEDEQ
jgi:hypothetical protein